MKHIILPSARQILLLPFLLFPFFAMAQTQLEKFVPGSTVEGVSYYLPRTALRIVVRAEKKVVLPGDFHMYAFKYMRMQDVPVRSTTTWTVKGIDMLPYGVPDSAKAYSIKLKDRTVAPLVTLSPDGLLLAVNAETAQETLPAVPESSVLSKPILPEQVRSYMNREMLQASSVAKMAELVAREIYDIRESRDALVRGEADNTPKDGEQLRLMLDNLDAQQKALMSLFVGTTEVSEEYYVLEVLPSDQTDKELLFRFSQWTGLVDADDMSGAPFYMSVKVLDPLPEPSVDAKVQAKKDKMLRALYYNVPVRTEVKVFDAHREYVSMEIPMAQFGCEEILSGVLFDKMASTKVTFYQSTGGIKQISE